MKKLNSVFIIAEAGVNHNGNISMAKKMIDAAKMAGADAIKFQLFKSEKFISRYAPKAEYQKRTTGKVESQLEMIRSFELDIEDHEELMRYCRKKGIKFLSTPFDLESIESLERLGLDVIKIPSGEITNLPYLRKVGQLKKSIIMSTGMSNLKEIRDALRVLVKSGTPKKNITVLQCNTEYPTPMKDANLKAMLTIRKKSRVKVGYSDHTLGIEVPIAACALGAKVIEKHFTLNRDLPGPDHKASLEPSELEAMVRAIRNVELALGHGKKIPSPSEKKNKLIARKSIVACKYIRKGEVFTEENITVKRPGSGVSPMKWDRVLGRVAKRDFKEDRLIEI